jgi:5-methylcytosine-specific restriction endonuclease McrA
MDHIYQFIDSANREGRTISSGDIWKVHNEKWDCNHEFAGRYRVIANGSKIFGLQCVVCGAWKAKSRSHFGVDIPIKEYDESIRERFWKERRIESERVGALILDAQRTSRDNETAKRKEQYYQYLKTPRWAATRRAVLERDRFICQGCLCEEATEVHHITYDNIGSELFFQLVSVCRKCHAKIHGNDMDKTDLSGIIK